MVLSQFQLYIGVLVAFFGALLNEIIHKFIFFIIYLFITLVKLGMEYLKAVNRPLLPPS